ATLCAGFSEHERSFGKIERRQILTSCEFCVWRSPMQSPRDHQVQHQPEIAFESERDPLTDSPQFPHYAAFDACNRRLRSSKEKGASQSHSLESLAHNQRLQRSDVSNDVRQFWHMESG